jgi:hypothetical protein
LVSVLLYLISGNWKHIYAIFQYLLTMFEFVKPDKSCLMSSSIFGEEMVENAKQMPRSW